jgi:hypothetical protein
MKRLYSYWTYPFVFVFLFLDVFFTYLLFNTYNVSFKLLFLVALLNLILLAGFIICLKGYKRVYLKDSSLYVYDLYSNIPYILPLEQLRGIERDNSRFAVFWGIYKASFLIENGNYYTVAFMKNKLIFDLRKYI